MVAVGLLRLNVRWQRCEPGVVDGCGFGLNALETGLVRGGGTDHASAMP